MPDSADPVPLFGPEMLADPYPIYDRLRAEDPVHRSEQFKAWIITRYDEVAAGLNDLRLSSDRSHLLEQYAASDELKPFFSFLSQRMVLVDPPRHTRLRGLVSKAFTPHVIEAMRPHIQQLVDGFIDAAIERGRMDIIRDLAFPLPATVIMEMLGIPPQDRDRFKQWSDAFVVFFSTHPSKISTDQYRRAQDAMVAMVEYFKAAMAQIRSSGAKCLLQTMRDAEDRGEQLTEEEIFANANLLLIAGHETTTHLIGNGMAALLQNPEQMQLLREDPTLIPRAVEEFLRFVGPVQFTHRIALEDVQLAGKTIHKGDLVFLFIAAANRDPAHFPQPDRLNVRNDSHNHLAFGKGHHFCLGAPLARLEAQIAFATLLTRLPNLKLTEERLEHQDNLNLRGLRSLNITFA